MLRIIALVALLTSSPVFCQTLEERERQRAMDEFDIAAKRALQAAGELSKATKRQCLTAVSNEPLCACLADKLPMMVNFVQYVSLVTMTKEELDYEKLSPADKKVVDLVRGARDQCIATKR